MHSHRKVYAVVVASLVVAIVSGFLKEGHFDVAHCLNVCSEIGTLSASAAIAMLFGGE